MTEINFQEPTIFDFDMTETIAEKFWKFSLVKGVNYKVKRKIYFVILVIIGPVPILFDLIYYGLIYGNHLDVLDFYDWTLAMFMLILSCLYLYRYFFSGKNHYRNTPQMQAHYTYVFDQEGFKVSSVSAISTHQSEIKYSLIHTIYETEDAFYILITNRTGYAIDKAGLTQGNLIAFRITLKTALNKKYVLCR